MAQAHLSNLLPVGGAEPERRQRCPVSTGQAIRSREAEVVGQVAPVLHPGREGGEARRVGSEHLSPESRWRLDQHAAVLQQATPIPQLGAPHPFGAARFHQIGGGAG